MPRLRHYDHLGSARFVTFSCYHRFRLLRHPATIRTFLAGLRKMQEGGTRILGYVIMPERVHLVVLPPDGLRLGIEIGRLKSLIARDNLNPPQADGAPGSLSNPESNENTISTDSSDRSQVP